MCRDSLASQNANGINPNLKDPYTQKWNLTVERQVHSFGLSASYTGSRSVNLLYNRNLNEPAPSTTPFSTTLYPNQLFGSINYYDNGGNEFYNGLELLAQRKFGKSLTFNTGFTWAKDMTDTQHYGGTGSNYAGPQLQNQFCRACQKANNAMGPPRRWYLYGVYALPAGQGQHFGDRSAEICGQWVYGGATWGACWIVRKSQLLPTDFRGGFWDFRSVM